MTDTVNVPVDEVLDAVADYLVEQYGKSFGLNHHLDRARIKSYIHAQPEAQKGEPVAWRRRLIWADVWTVFSDKAEASFYSENPETIVEPLYTHPATSSELLEALEPDFLAACAAAVADEYPATSQSLHCYALKQSDLIAKHKGPQS